MLTSCCKFSLNREKDPDWDADIRDDVLEECTKYGHVFHIHVDKNSNQVCIESSVQFSFVYPDWTSGQSASKLRSRSIQSINKILANDSTGKGNQLLMKRRREKKQ